MNEKGLTLIELLIVIVVLGIIAGFSIVKVDSIITSTRINVDSFNLSTLNTATEDYGEQYASGASDIFAGIDNDLERMSSLVTYGFLDSLIRVQQPDATMEWNVSSQSWNLIGGEINGYFGGSAVSYTFSDDSLDDLIDDGTLSLDLSDWSTDNGYLENTTGESRIFVPISSSTYTIDVSAALSAGTSGGYGIFFDTTIDGDDASKDSGFVLQFDRGYGDGAIIVRPRTDGSENSPVWSFRDYDATTFPRKSEDPDWWTDPHDISIVVTSVDSDTREAEFFLDGASIGSYSYAAETDVEQLYTGFRGWGSSSTEFYSLDAD